MHVLGCIVIGALTCTFTRAAPLRVDGEDVSTYGLTWASSCSVASDNRILRPNRRLRLGSCGQWTGSFPELADLLIELSSAGRRGGEGLLARSPQLSLDVARPRPGQEFGRPARLAADARPRWPSR